MSATPFRVALVGDVIIRRKVSTLAEPKFLKTVELLRADDCSIGNFESIIHDFEGPGVYPAAEAGWTWMRSPRFATEEVRWLGLDAVSLANNHSLDYSHGGVIETRKATADAGIPCAGTGRNLEEAQLPAYVETSSLWVGLVSMATSFAKWARAGRSYDGIPGRPGVNRWDSIRCSIRSG
jgi:hypothetical protein